MLSTLSHSSTSLRNKLLAATSKLADDITSIRTEVTEVKNHQVSMGQGQMAMLSRLTALEAGSASAGGNGGPTREDWKTTQSRLLALGRQKHEAIAALRLVVGVQLQLSKDKKL